MDPMPSPRGVPPSTHRPKTVRFHRAPPDQAREDARHESVSAELRDRFARELQRAKLDAMKELAYGASHEINNPLANIALRMQSLLKREDDPEKRKMIEAAHRSAMRAHEMISDLMLFARPPALKRSDVCLVGVIDRVVEEMREVARAHGVVLSRQPRDDRVIAWADPVQVAVVVSALINNAIEAIGRERSAGAIVVSAQRRGSDLVVLETADDGPGIEEAILPHVFDPFFSGREAGRGLGFGLSKCWRIVTDHGGEIRLDNNTPSGVRATVTLPAAGEGADS